MTATAEPDLPEETDPVESPELVEEVLEELELVPEVLPVDAVGAVVVDVDVTPGIVSALT